jgi:hypothetical protein
MDKVVVFLPPFRMVKVILTAFLKGQVQILEDPMLIFVDHVHSTQLFHTHIETVSIFPKTKPLEASILITRMIEASIDVDL